MDPFSLTAGCAGLLSSVVDLYGVASDFVRDVRDARRDIDALRSELTLIRCCVEHLQEDTTDSNFQIPANLQNSLINVLAKCNGIIVDMNKTLTKMAPTSLAKRIQWAASGKDEVNRLRVRLGDYKSSLDISLEIASMSISKSLQNGLSDLTQDTAHIKTTTSCIETNTAAIKADTEAIKENTNGLTKLRENVTLILEKISLLQLELPQQSQESPDQSFALQRFLEESTQYARSIVGECELTDNTPTAGIQTSFKANLKVRKKRRVMIREFLHDAEKRALDRALLDCVKDRYRVEQAELETLLDLGADVNVTGKRGEALIAVLVDKNSVLEARFLLMEGFPSQKTLNRTLSQAALRGNVELVQLLLSLGANPKWKVCHRRCWLFAEPLFGNALYHACWGGHLDTVKLLLESGSDRTLQEGGALALCAASNRGHEHIVNLLILEGTSVDCQAEAFGSPLQAACLSGQYRIAQSLLGQRADVTIQGGRYGSALQAAAYEGTLQVVQLLLDHGADVNTQGGRHGSALQAAVIKGTLRVVQLLLDHGANVSLHGGEYGSALQAVAYTGPVEIMCVLLDRKADVNTQGGEFGSALHAAAYAGNVEKLQLLLRHGADINIQGGPYGTALQAAAYRGNLEAVQLLLDHGADVNIKGQDFGSALQAAVISRNVEVVRLLLDRGADINIQGGRYGSTLHAAACENDVKIMQILLDHGADVNTTNGELRTALVEAVRYRNMEMTQLLLHHGADINTIHDKLKRRMQTSTLQEDRDFAQLLWPSTIPEQPEKGGKEEDHSSVASEEEILPNSLKEPQ